MTTALVAAAVLGRDGWPRSALPIAGALAEGTLGWAAIRLAAGDSPVGLALFLVGAVLPLVIVALAIRHCSAHVRAQQVPRAA